MAPSRFMDTGHEVAVTSLSATVPREARTTLVEPETRLMIYSQDGLGLGHMRRTSSIAAEFLKRRPNGCVVTVHDSPLGTFFALPRNEDYVKLPSIVKLGPGQWEAVKLPLEFGSVLAMRRDLIRATAVHFEPDVLLVDHMPHGAMGELVPALEALKERASPAKIVLGLRDIIDSPEVIRQRWLVEGAMEAIERHYDRVLVYGCQDLFDLSEAYRLPAPIAARLRYIGYVCTPGKPRYAARLRAEHTSGSENGRKLIVAMAGGGADAYPMMRMLLNTVPRLGQKLRFFLIMIAGPFMPAKQRRDLQARAAGLPVRVRISVSDSLSYIAAADLVVAMAGYNTTAEILRAGTPAVLVPRAGPSAEQAIRAGLFQACGWVHVIEPETATPARVAATLLQAMRSKRTKVVEDYRLDGLSAAADELLALVPHRDREPVLVRDMG